MSMNIVNSNGILRQRVKNYFTSDAASNKVASELMHSLAEHAHVYIFGGMIRDLGLYGTEGFSSDIDLVYEGSQQALRNTLSRIGITNPIENKFGGFRFHFSQHDFDIWCLEDTWAFKNKHISLKDVNSLLKTTLMSWDAIIYDFSKNEIIAEDNYLNNLVNRHLDLILPDTPNLVGSMVKILRTIYIKDVVSLGPKLCGFLHERMLESDIDDIIEYEQAHYEEQTIEKEYVLNLHNDLSCFNYQNTFTLKQHHLNKK